MKEIHSIGEEKQNTATKILLQITLDNLKELFDTMITTECLEIILGGVNFYLREATKNGNHTKYGSKVSETTACEKRQITSLLEMKSIIASILLLILTEKKSIDKGL